MNYERMKTEYAVGALLYTPAVNEKAADFVEKHIGLKYSFAFCLEDSIEDEAYDEGVRRLGVSLERIGELSKKYGREKLPQIFVRVRKNGQMEEILKSAGINECIIKGFIAPKFDMSNAVSYAEEIKEISRLHKRKIYLMPILESADIMDIIKRREVLGSIKSVLDNVRDYVLNVRMGGNDFSNLFGIRHGVNETVYDMGVVASAVFDIINVFGREYTVSGVVWDYFENAQNKTDILWKTGLKKEIRLDILNGIIGKTVIHPTQIEVVNAEMAVDGKDYEDAKNILGWSSELLAVGKSADGGRMNEKKTHSLWAKKILARAEIYGIREDCGV